MEKKKQLIGVNREKVTAHDYHRYYFFSIENCGAGCHVIMEELSGGMRAISPIRELVMRQLTDRQESDGDGAPNPTYLSQWNLVLKDSSFTHVTGNDLSQKQ